MKKQYILILLLLLIVNSSLPCKANEKTDTITITKLTSINKHGKEYEVIQIYNNTTSRKYLQLHLNNKVVQSIILPLPDDDVKNFLLEKISRTKNGFKISISWGDWQNFYENSYYFINQNDEFYLEKVSIKWMTDKLPKTKNKTIIITPSVPFSKFDMTKYLQ